MLHEILKSLPEEAKDDALVLACQALSAISQGDMDMKVMPPGSPLVALRTLLECTGTVLTVVNSQEDAEKLAAAARSMGLEASTCHLGADAERLAAETIAKAQKH